MARAILHGFEQELAHALVHRSKSHHAREELRAGDWSRVGSLGFAQPRGSAKSKPSD